MSLLSVKFGIFLLISLAVYFLIPQALQWKWLLACSAVFALFAGMNCFLFLTLCVLSTYLAGILMDSQSTGRWKKTIFVSVIVFLGSILFLLKLYNYYSSLMSRVLCRFNGESVQLPIIDLVAPLGISYYTLQGISYCADVYSGRIKAEKSFFRHALFLSYFPQITQGPISRYEELSNRLFNGHSFNYLSLSHGGQLALWGLFKKMVIADRLRIYTSMVFSAPPSGSAVIFGAMMYSFQLYADFSGCMDLIRGCSEMYGIILPANFDHPFSATSVKEFWRRWHISLSSWLRDYVYIPLGGSRKGRIRKYINLTATFLVSGLWHGAGLGFVFWGILHAVYQILEDLLLPETEKNNKHWGAARNTAGFIFLQRLSTFIPVSLAWVFFCAPGAGAAFQMLRLILTDFNFPALIRSFYSCGLDREYLFILPSALVAMLALESCQKNYSVRSKIDSQPMLVRWCIYLSGIVAVILFGNYGINVSGMFIYAGF